MKFRALPFFVLLCLVAGPAFSQAAFLPGFFGRIFSDVEGYAYGGMTPLDTDAPRGFGYNAGLTLFSQDAFKGLALSAGYGSSTGANPWRIDGYYTRVDPDFGSGANGLGVTGRYQILAEEGRWAVNASAAIEIVDDAYNYVSLAANGEYLVPGTDLAFGASLGVASIDPEIGRSETDLTAAFETIYSIRDSGIAVSLAYVTRTDVTDAGLGITATWALHRDLPLPPGSNIRLGVFEETVFVRYRVRF